MTLISFISRWLLSTGFMACSLAAQAQPLVFVPSDDLATGLMQNLLARDLLKNHKQHRGKLPSPHQNAGTTVLVGVSQPTMPAKLSAAHPADQHRRAARMYGEALQAYRQIEIRFGIPRHDVAGAVAVFIAGSWMAYRDAELPDAHFEQLVLQMREGLVGNAEFRNASRSDKQALNEQLAIFGTTLMSTREVLKLHPDPSAQLSLRETGRRYLQTFLGADADRVAITASGLRFD